MKKLISGLIALCITLSLIPIIESNATETLSIDRFKAYIGTVILSSADVKLSGQAMKEHAGTQLVDSLIQNNEIDFKLSNGSFAYYSDLINADNTIKSEWSKVFRLKGDAHNSIWSYINTIPTETFYIKTPVEMGKMYSFSKMTVTYVNAPAFNIGMFYSDGKNKVTNVQSAGATESILEMSNTQTGFTSSINGNRWITDSRHLMVKFTPRTKSSGLSIRTAIPYTLDTTVSKDLNLLKSRLPYNRGVTVPNIFSSINLGDGIFTWDTAVSDSVDLLSNNNTSTITVNANIEPYLEVALGTNSIELNNTTSKNSSTTLAVESNMNYKVESKFSGLKNADNSEVITSSSFGLDVDSNVISLTDNEYVACLNSIPLGQKIHNIDLSLKNPNLIKADTYNGTLEFKVSQL